MKISRETGTKLLADIDGAIERRSSLDVSGPWNIAAIFAVCTDRSGSLDERMITPRMVRRRHSGAAITVKHAKLHPLREHVVNTIEMLCGIDGVEGGEDWKVARIGDGNDDWWNAL